jgi:exonuclease III
MNNNSFYLTNIYGPSGSAEKYGFMTWLLNLDKTDYNEWIMVGDFNLYRSPEDRNKPDGNSAKMQMFNELIIDLDVLEIPLSGQKYTWRDRQLDPLLVKLDWVFTSTSWNLSYPATNIQPLSRPISDHTPFVINIGTNIPKATVFRFENFWVKHADFLKTVDLHWNNAPFFSNAARNISQRMKQGMA